MKIVRRILFLLLIIILTVTYFTRNNFRNVQEIDPQILNDPIQIKIENANPVKIVKDNYEYNVQPLYNYEINGLIVHKINYNFFSLQPKMDKIFPMDFCIIWGKNVSSGVYKNPNLKITQDNWWCQFQYSGFLDLSPRDLSNNHLIITDPKIEDKLKSVLVGDLIKIKGKLASIHGTNLDKNDKENPQYFDRGTSITRDDTGNGACEQILVDDIQILKRTNSLSNFLFYLSLYGLIILFISRVFTFLYSVLHTKKDKTKNIFRPLSD